MSIHCRREECRHDIHGHDPESPHNCHETFQIATSTLSFTEHDCTCPAFLYIPEVAIGQTDLAELALQEAAAHLAGLGRGKHHRVDVVAGPNDHAGSVKLDGVELRGVTGFKIESRVGDLTRITLSMVVSIGRDNDP